MTPEDMAKELEGRAIYKDYGRENACYAGHVQGVEVRGNLVLLKAKIGHDRIGEVLRVEHVERLLNGQVVTLDKENRITLRVS